MPSPSPPASSHVLAERIAAAVEERNRHTEVSTAEAHAHTFLLEHDKRQAFRRMIDPGITRPNSHEHALAALQTLLKISENLLGDIDNLESKYRQFKPTNSVIKRTLVEPKGALEYAIALGFRPEVVKFQPYYTWNPHKRNELQIGYDMLKEYLAVEIEKEERNARRKEEEKAAREAAALKVKLAYMDDRKSKLLVDQREKEAREARAQLMTERAEQGEEEEEETESSKLSSRRMPGTGRSLRSSAEDTSPYVDDVDGNSDVEY